MSTRVVMSADRRKQLEKHFGLQELRCGCVFIGAERAEICEGCDRALRATTAATADQMGRHMATDMMSVLDAVEQVYGREARERIVIFMARTPEAAPAMARAAAARPVALREPQPAVIFCPYCGARHVDKDEWQTRPHHKHLCAGCGKLFRYQGADGEYFYGAPGAPKCGLCADRHVIDTGVEGGYVLSEPCECTRR
jgi:hypothetical protein